MDSFMEEAFIEARNALTKGEVPVGCVFVYNNQIIARGANDVNATKNATRHAELVCIDRTLEFCKTKGLDWKDVMSNISVVVTVEPCVMCIAALYQMMVKEITYGCANNRFGGESIFDVANVLKPTTVINSGVRAEEAMQLLKDFYKGENPSAPFPKSKR